MVWNGRSKGDKTRLFECMFQDLVAHRERFEPLLAPEKAELMKNEYQREFKAWKDKLGQTITGRYRLWRLYKTVGEAL